MKLEHLNDEKTFFDTVKKLFTNNFNIPLSIKDHSSKPSFLSLIKEHHPNIIKDAQIIGVINEEAFNNKFGNEYKTSTEATEILLTATIINTLPDGFYLGESLYRNINKSITDLYINYNIINIYKQSEYITISYTNHGKTSYISNIDIYNTHEFHEKLLMLFDINNRQIFIHTGGRKARRDITNLDFFYIHLNQIFDVGNVVSDFCDRVADWYVTALRHIKTNHIENNKNYLLTVIIKLLLMWFLKEYGIVSESFFNEKYIKVYYQYDGDDCIYDDNIYQQRFLNLLLTNTLTEKFFIDKYQSIKDYINILLNINSDINSYNEYFYIPDYIFFGTHRNITGLFDILKSYNYTIKENTLNDINIIINPSVIGDLIEKIYNSCQIESKGINIDSAGTYYTPLEIAEFMITESLVAYLKNGLNTYFDDEHMLEQNIRKLCSNSNLQPFTKNDMINRIIDLIDECKILDPACGCGVFPCILIYSISTILNKITTKSKVSIMLLNIINNIVAVDIQATAVLITRFRVLFSLFSLHKKNIHPADLIRKVVPAIQKNIICNDALFLNSTNIRKISQNHSVLKNSSFDIVLGNPPYVDSETMVKLGMKELRKQISRNYDFAKGNWDMYIVFFELAFRKVKDNGCVIFITPDKWISKAFGKALRKASLKYLSMIVKAGRHVFENAGVDSVISLFIKKASEKFSALDSPKNNTSGNKIIIKNKIGKPYRLDIVFSKHINHILEMDGGRSTFESRGFICENACSTADAYKLKKYIRDYDFNTPDNLCYKLINTGTISKFASRWGKKEITYIKNKYLYPVVDKQAFHDNFTHSYAKKTKSKKIIIKGLSLLDAFTDDKGEYIPGKSTLVIPYEKTEDASLLSLIINSSLFQFYITEKYPASSYNVGVNFTKDMINNLPIPITNHNRVITNLHTMLKYLKSARYSDMFKIFYHITNAFVLGLYYKDHIGMKKLNINSLIENDFNIVLPGADFHKLCEKDQEQVISLLFSMWDGFGNSSVLSKIEELRNSNDIFKLVL